ncbi:MAG: response regulator [bacterium]|nr:response regulator [bacterium]
MVDDFRRTKTILVVDPAPEVREMLATLLKGYGYHVKEARDAAAGVVSFREGDVELVLMEMSADQSAVEGIGSLRSAPGGEEVPVVALVQAGAVGGVAAMLDAGCDDFLLKPVSPRLLFQRIQSLLESNPRAYNRVECNVVAEATTGTELVAGILREIGEGGAGMLVGEKLTPGDIVKVTFPLPRSKEDLVVGAEIVYAREVDEQFLHGLRFIIIDTATRKVIRKFVQDTLLERS